MTPSSAPLTTSLPFMGLVLLSFSCRAAHDGQTTEESEQTIHEELVSYTADYSDVPLPPNTYRLTLPHVSPLDDYRVELLPALPNNCPKHTSLDGRFVPSTQLDAFSSYRYEPGAGPVSACDKPIKGGAPLPYLYGEPLLLPFRGNKELAVTTNDSVCVAYRIWHAMGKPVELAPDTTNSHLRHKPGYTPYVITAPAQHKGKSASYYIELIPCRRMKVDCNIHVLNGAFELDMEAQGLNLPYIFKSDGRTMSTRMACPDDQLEEKLIRHMGLVVLRGAGESVTVYIPEGFILLSRPYRPEGERTFLPNVQSRCPMKTHQDDSQR